MDEHEHKQHFHIAGMSCTNCARRVEQSLSKLDGLQQESAMFSYLMKSSE